MKVTVEYGAGETRYPTSDRTVYMGLHCFSGSEFDGDLPGVLKLCPLVVSVFPMLSSQAPFLLSRPCDASRVRGCDTDCLKGGR